MRFKFVSNSPQDSSRHPATESVVPSSFSRATGVSACFSAMVSVMNSCVYIALRGIIIGWVLMVSRVLSKDIRRSWLGYVATCRGTGALLHRMPVLRVLVHPISALNVPLDNAVDVSQILSNWTENVGVSSRESFRPGACLFVHEPRHRHNGRGE